MKRLLLIKAGLATGGTTTSFISLINALKKQNEYQIDVWINAQHAADAGFHNAVRVVRIPELEEAFLRGSSIKERIRDLVKYRQIGLYCKCRMLLRRHTNEAKCLIPIYQEMDIRRSFRMKKVDLSNYDAVITWEEMFPAYFLANAVTANKKIAWIHPDYIQCGFQPQLDLPSFEKLDALIAVSEQGRQSMQKMLPSLRERVWAIENIVPVNSIREKALDEIKDMTAFPNLTMVTVARLQNVSKAFDRAVRIAARLRDEGIAFQWYIVGDGEDRDNIRQMIDGSHLQKNMILLGAKDNPYPYIKAADLFVLQSYYEGKPVSVDEALILGTPVFVTDYAAARKQVDDRYGWVVENREDAIFQGLRELLLNPGMIMEKKNALVNMDTQKYESLDDFINMAHEVIGNDHEDI